jgi:GrpB-like predicted nucleotidyltransferase (UPF0157 family)
VKYQLDRKSRDIVIVPHQARWREEFSSTGSQLRNTLNDLALRIDHIVSTSVQGLSSKDIIDIQITVSDLDDCSAFCTAMVNDGYIQKGDIHEDHIPVGMNPCRAEWRKRYFREPLGERRTHIHVREMGRANQAYAILFRDYLRANNASRQLYQQIKLRLSELFPNKIDSYLYLKDPVCDLIIQSAIAWKESIDWKLTESDA